MSEKKEKQWLVAAVDAFDNIRPRNMRWFDARSTARKFAAGKNATSALLWKVFPIQRGPGA